MTPENFIESAGFATILTALVTVATCFINNFQGNRKIKIEKFEEVYNCIQDFSNENEKIMKKCNRFLKKIAEGLPETVEEDFAENYFRRSYSDFHKLLSAYSRYLNNLMSFYHFLYKDKPNIPVTREECWDILRLYAEFTSIACLEAQDCKLNYLQIAALVQFIKSYSGVSEKVKLYNYFKKYNVFQKWSTRFAKAFFYN